ncbi:MAG: TonB-dependent receptor [Deltaproteobacteria bacterium]|nr:TonB-dependent receptor [Deltaproteobacteria bacterium]
MSLSLPARGAAAVGALMFIFILSGAPVAAQSDAGVPPDAHTEAGPEDDEDPAPPADGDEETDGAGEEPAEPSRSEESPPSEREGGASVSPPRIVRSPAPTYPTSAAGSGLHPTVVIEVTLDDGGHVLEAQVEHSGGQRFDAAAIEAVQGWTFEPARRGDTPIAARVRVAVHFDLPSFDLPSPVGDPSAGSSRTTESAPVETDTSDDPSEEEPSFGATAEVEAEELRRQQRSASAFTANREVLEAAPHQEGADLLSVAPGFYAARPAGAAIAHRIMIRGFDAKHGQDVALSVGGLPINLPSHVHGQGYADLGFLIPEVVSQVRVLEGVHDPRQGDFAVAGSAAFDLAVERRGVTLKTGYGSFGTFRQLALWAPEDAADETFGAVQVQRSDGFGQNRRSLATSAIVQVASPRGRGGWRFRVLGIANVARADLAGVLRDDDITSGRVDFYDVYQLPTAVRQNAANTRLMVGVFGSRRFASGANAEVGVFAGADLFRTQQNFTGFIQESRTLEDVAGRGDLIEQRNRTTTAGLKASYRSPRAAPWSWLEARVELGTETRLDWITQEQNLIDATVRNQTWDERVDADVFGTDIGLYGDVELTFAERAVLSVGARADVLFYEIDDRLGNFAPDSRPDDTFIMGFRRSAMGVAGGPRASLAVEATDWLSLLGAYGEGFRSPQARFLEDGERAPFTKVRSADVGLRAQWDELLTVTIGGYWTRLGDDVAFEPEEAALRRIGATRRLGAVAHVQARPLPWLVAAGSVTYVDAELLEPPPPSVEEPNPPFEEGQNLPYVPPVVVRLDVGARGPLGELRGQKVTGRVGAGFSYLSPRPLPFGFNAAPVALLDASAGVAWGPVEIGFSVFNLLGSEYAAFELYYVSDWTNGGVRSRVPARHIQAGAPRTLMGTVELAW